MELLSPSPVLLYKRSLRLRLSAKLYLTSVFRMEDVCDDFEDCRHRAD